MFIKQLKYDFLFSRNAFLGMGALMIGLAVIFRMTDFFGGTNSASASFVWAGLSLSIATIVVAVASVFQIFNLFNRSFFGNSGYLMLTLPICRTRQLISKLIVSMIWFNYMLVVAFCMAFIFAFDTSAQNTARNLFVWNFGGFLRALFEGFLTSNSIAFLLIAVIFLGITLAHSIIGRWRIHGFIAGIVSFVYLVFTIRVASVVESVMFRRIVYWSSPVYSGTLVIVPAFLFFGIGAVLITNHLLKERVDLY